MKELTLVSCSYNTPEITTTMLKSFYHNHKSLISKIHLVLMENSTNEETTAILDSYKVPYIRRKGSTHSIAVDEALKTVKTKYALLVDTDVVFHKPISLAYNIFKEQTCVSMGKLCGSRGGYNLIPRIHPWFNLINIEEINRCNISFHDQKRIDDSNSGSFFGNIPLNFDKTGRYYDVGSTFLEDILINNLKVVDINAENNIFTHYEGMSWYKNVEHQFFQGKYDSNYKRFMIEYNRYKGVNIKNRFMI